MRSMLPEASRVPQGTSRGDQVPLPDVAGPARTVAGPAGALPIERTPATDRSARPPPAPVEGSGPPRRRPGPGPPAAAPSTTPPRPPDRPHGSGHRSVATPSVRTTSLRSHHGERASEHRRSPPPPVGSGVHGGPGWHLPAGRPPRRHRRRAGDHPDRVRGVRRLVPRGRPRAPAAGGRDRARGRHRRRQRDGRRRHHRRDRGPCRPRPAPRPARRGARRPRGRGRRPLPWHPRRPGVHPGRRPRRHPRRRRPAAGPRSGVPAGRGPPRRAGADLRHLAVPHPAGRPRGPGPGRARHHHRVRPPVDAPRRRPVGRPGRRGLRALGAADHRAGRLRERGHEGGWPGHARQRLLPHRRGGRPVPPRRRRLPGRAGALVPPRRRCLRPRSVHVRVQLPGRQDVVDYEVVWAAFERLARRFDPAEQDHLFAATARRTYRL